jgi:serine/threonine protein kinase
LESELPAQCKDVFVFVDLDDNVVVRYSAVDTRPEHKGQKVAVKQMALTTDSAKLLVTEIRYDTVVVLCCVVLCLFVYSFFCFLDCWFVFLASFSFNTCFVTIFLFYFCSIMKTSHHPNIVDYNDSFIVGAQIWVVMELMDGGCLTEVLEQVGDKTKREERMCVFIVFLCLVARAEDDRAADCFGVQGHAVCPRLRACATSHSQRHQGS